MEVIFTKAIGMKDKDFAVSVTYDDVFGEITLNQATLIRGNGDNMICDIDFTGFFKQFIPQDFIQNAFKEQIEEHERQSK